MPEADQDRRSRDNRKRALWWLLVLCVLLSVGFAIRSCQNDSPMPDSGSGETSEEEARDLDPTPTAPARLSGIVIDARGEARSRFVVTLRIPGQDTRPVSVKTDTRGRFEFTGVPVGTPLRLGVLQPGFHPFGIDVETLSEGEVRDLGELDLRSIR